MSAKRVLNRNFVLGFVAATMLAAATYAAEPTAQDPAALAAQYDKQAAELRASAEKHEKMGSMHQGGAGSTKVNHENVVKHCQAIAKELRAAADESAALAEEYRKAASK